MSTTSSPRVDPIPREANLRTLAARQMMRAMFTGRIVAGDRLVITKIADQLGSSSTPVREAMVELYTLGLVELLPNRGAVCLPYGSRQLREMYLVRGVLEAEATRLAGGTLPTAEGPRKRLRRFITSLEELRQADDTRPEWSREALAIDVALHDLIVENCGVARLDHEIGRYKELMGCIREVVGNERSIQQIAVAEHIDIAELLLAGQPEDAARAMRKHLSHTADMVSEMLFSE